MRVMAITISEETKTKTRQVPLDKNISNFVPVSPIDMEAIAPSPTRTTLPTAIWFAHEKVLYEFLTPTNFNEINYYKIMTLVSRHVSFRLYTKVEDNLDFLRYVEECRTIDQNKSSQQAKIENRMLNVRRQAQQVFDSIADMKISSYIVETSTQVVKDIIATSLNSSAVVSLLTKMINMDGNYLNHAISVSMVSTALGKHMELSDLSISTLSQAAFFHDIGHFKLPSRILRSKDMSGDELEEFKTHANHGQEILDELSQNGFKIPTEVEIVALQHHEKFNGYGYPNRLSGRQEDKDKGTNGIHIFSRIVSIADAYCELIERAPNNALAPEIHTRLVNQVGSFDPAILSRFKDLV